jgi:CubicO group peptidase (beta-lactamase class C family)
MLRHVCAEFARSWILTLIVALSIGVGRDASAAPTPNHPNNPAPVALRPPLDNALIAYMQAGRIPGLATVVVRDGQVRWIQAYGVLDSSKPANLASNKVAVTSPFRVASVSKTITAALILRLAEAGYLPTPYIDQYLPADLPVVNPAFPGARITLTQLLLHTSSIADPRAPYFPPSNISDATLATMLTDAVAGTLTYEDPRIVAWAGVPGSAGKLGVGDLKFFYAGTPAADTPLSVEQYLRGVLVPGGADYPSPAFEPNRSYFATAPGARYGYSNVNITLLGYIAERVAAAAGQPRSFAQLADSVVFAPLGMTRSSFSINTTDPSVLAATAVPHTYASDAVAVLNRKAMVNVFCLRLGCSPRYPDSELVLPADYQPAVQYGVAERPAKGLRTSIADLGRFVSMLAARGSINGRPFLAASTVDEMAKVQFADGEHTVGLGMFKFTLSPEVVPNDVVWGHSGADAGAAACMLFSKTTGYGMAVIMNAPEYGDGSCDVVRAIYAYAYANRL